MRETKHFKTSFWNEQVAKTSNFPWQGYGTKWMISFYLRIIRHPNCSLTPPIPTTKPNSPPKEKMEKQDVSGIVWDQTVSGCQCETNESSKSYSCWCEVEVWWYSWWRNSQRKILFSTSNTSWNPDRIHVCHFDSVLMTIKAVYHVQVSLEMVDSEI